MNPKVQLLSGRPSAAGTPSVAFPTPTTMPAYDPALARDLTRYAETQLPTAFGTLRCVIFRAGDGTEHVAMVAGEIRGEEDVLCRVHSECLTSEVLGSLKCDCKNQLDRALERIATEGRGVVLYLRQEGRGIGLGNKIRAYALQEQGHDTVDANRMLGLPDDSRDYTVAVRMLEDLGVESIALMTNNPLKVEGVSKAGFPVSRREGHLVEVPSAALGYVKAKADRMGHLIDKQELAQQHEGGQLAAAGE